MGNEHRPICKNPKAQAPNIKPDHETRSLAETQISLRRTKKFSRRDAEFTEKDNYWAILTQPVPSASQCPQAKRAIDTFQLTMSAVIHKKFNIVEGDFVDIEEKEGGIFLRPVKMISPDQEYFYTKQWQAAGTEADKDISDGKMAGPFQTVNELFNDLVTVRAMKVTRTDKFKKQQKSSLAFYYPTLTTLHLI